MTTAHIDGSGLPFQTEANPYHFDAFGGAVGACVLLHALSSSTTHGGLTLPQSELSFALATNPNETTVRGG